MGGPGTLDDVEPFLINLFSDRDIIELPLGALLQPVVARIIAKARGNGVRRNYASIGGGSPQLPLTRAQAAALEDRLTRETGRRHVVEVAMRYWQPDTATALERLAAQGVARLVTLTLYPHYSRATTGSSRREFDRLLAHAAVARALRREPRRRVPRSPAVPRCHGGDRPACARRLPRTAARPRRDPVQRTRPAEEVRGRGRPVRGAHPSHGAGDPRAARPSQRARTRLPVAHGPRDVDRSGDRGRAARPGPTRRDARC